jgi:hypothetical protein
MSFTFERCLPNTTGLPHFARRVRVFDPGGRNCCRIAAGHRKGWCRVCGNMDTVLVKNEWVWRMRREGSTAGVFFEYMLAPTLIHRPKPAGLFYRLFDCARQPAKSLLQMATSNLSVMHNLCSKSP